MSTSYVVVSEVRQHFGNNRNAFSQFPFGVVIDDLVGAPVKSAAGSAPFVGPTKDFSFDCPLINPSIVSILMFQSLGVQHEGNLIQINPGSATQPSVFGGIPVIPSLSGVLPTWTSNVMLVGVRRLKETNNVLRVTSRPLAGSGSPDLDDFVLDNVVILYTEGQRGPVIGATLE